MSLEDVRKAIAEEQAKTASQQKAQAEADKPAKSDGSADKRKQDALQKISEKEVLYRMYIAQLASGKSKGKVLGAESLKRIEEAAVTLSEEIKDLQLIANPPAPEKEERVGSLGKSQLPFGGTSVGKVTGPITGGMDIQGQEPTPTDLKPITPSKPAKQQVAPGLGLQAEKPGKTSDSKKLTREEILARYPIIDALFEQDPELQALLNKYVDPKSKMTLKQFTDELSQAKFNFKYADVIKQRMANKAIYDRLGIDATGDTVYERDIAGITANLEATAKNLGASLTQDELNRVATNIYLAGTEARPLVIERALTPYIKLGVSPTTGRPTVSGAAGANYQSLLATAAANGISESLMPKVLGANTVDDVLRNLAEGASIRDYEQRFRDYAMNGRSDYVKNMLAQGVNFDIIVGPYRNVMADTLEIANPEQIKLDDPTLSMAFGDKEMTLSDFARTLRKDSRWQYTNKAREEVSNVALDVLRDFGFQR